MSTDRRAVLGRYFSEMGVIIVSVLIALAADSWWESRGEDVRESEYLRALEVDLAVSDSILSHILHQDGARLDSVRTTARVLSSSDPLAASDSLWRSGLVIAYDESAFNTATVNTLVTTGDLRLIADGDLRRGLGGFHSALETNTPRLRVLEEQMLLNYHERQRVVASMELTGDLSLASSRQNPDLVASVRANLARLSVRVEIHEDLREQVRSLLLMVSEERRRNDR